MSQEYEEIILLPLDSIFELKNVRDRELNKQHVESLVAKNEPEKWPPIIVCKIGDKYARIAGKHRIEAAKQLQINALKAIVRRYDSNQDAYMAMWEDNTKNGLPLSIKERKEFARGLYQINSGLSLREIGRRTGLPHQTVKAALEERQEPPREQDELQQIIKLARRIDKLYTAICEHTENMNIRETGEVIAYAMSQDKDSSYSKEDIEIFADILRSVAQKLPA